MSFRLQASSPGPPSAAQPAPRAARHRAIQAGRWGHFHPADLSAAGHPSSPAHPYQRATISHFPQSYTDAFPILDFPSNVPTIWGYQTLLGFTPGSYNQYHPYSSHLEQLPSSPPAPFTTPHYAQAEPSHFPLRETFPQTVPATATIPCQAIPYYHVPSSSALGQNAGFPLSDQPIHTAPAIKMFKCTLEPTCHMDFSRAEHLARHERKHTKEKPFTCHCSKSFSRLDNWRQHKVSVHKEDVALNASTEERLVRVHKSMQRQNNDRKAAAMAAQKQDRLERCSSMTESSGSAYSPAPSSFSNAGPGYARQSQPSPLPAKTPDKALCSQFGTPPFNSHPGLVSRPSSSLSENTASNPASEQPASICPVPSDSRSDPGTPFPAAHYVGHAGQSDQFHRLPTEYQPRLVNCNQVSRAPLSSIWPSFQQSSPYNSPSDGRTSTANESAAPMHKVAHLSNQSAGLFFTMNEGVPHHPHFPFSWTQQQAATLAPRKAGGSTGPQGEQGYLENQRAYPGYLFVGQNTPDFGASPARKRASPDETCELGSSGRTNEQPSVKKLRI